MQPTSAVGVEIVERPIDLGQERGIEGVQGLGPVQGDQADLAPRFDDDGLVAHAIALNG